jgi:hypothetical protein
MYLESLDDAEIARHSCSDRIWFHSRVFQNWISSDAGTVTFVQLKNRVDQSVIGCVYGVHHGDPETLYVPQWICDALDFDSDHIELERVTPSMCTGIVLQPHTSDHICAADPQEFLRDGFEQYSALTPGQTLDLWVGEDRTNDIQGHVMTCTVLRLLPSNETLAIRNCEMTLELMPPLDTPIPKPPTSTSTQSLAATSAAAAAVAAPSDGNAVMDEDPVIRRQRIAEAARARARIAVAEITEKK